MPINKRGGKGYSKNPRARKLERFKAKYGVEMNEWAKLKKNDPEKAKAIKERIKNKK